MRPRVRSCGRLSLAADPAGHPISYGVDGEQYIAIAVGGGLIDGLYISFTPELEAPTGSNAIFVFKLP